MPPSEPATFAVALITSNRVYTFTSIFAWFGGTFVDI